MDSERILFTESCVSNGENIYFMSMNENLLCSIDMATYKVHICSSIPEEDFFNQRLAGKIEIWNNKLILSPMNAKKIWIYDLKNEDWEGFDIKDFGEKYQHVKIFRTILHNDKLLFIGTSYPAIIEFDLKSKKMKYYHDLYKQLLKDCENYKDGFFRDNFVKMGQWIYMASCLRNIVLKLNIDTMEWEWVTVGDSENRYSGISFDGDYFWLSPRNNHVITKWDGKSHCEEYLIPETMRSGNMQYMGVICIGKYILFPRNGRSGGSVAILNGKISYIKENYTFYSIDESGMRMFQTIDGLLHREDEKNYFETKIVVDDMERQKYLSKAKINIKSPSEDDVYCENRKMDLNLFLAMIKNG